MATLDELFPSKYMKCSDLDGEELTVKILKAPTEVLKALDGREQTKCVLYFGKRQKSLPLNRTNFEMVQRVTGEEDSNNFPGHEITLYPTTTTMAGQIKDCIRVKSPEQAELLTKVAKKKPEKKPKKKSLREEMDDDIPDFGPSSADADEADAA